MIKFKRNIQLNGIHIFFFDQNLHSKETLNIYTAELPASHWNQAFRVSRFQVFISYYNDWRQGHQNAFARANATLLQGLIVKSKRSVEEEEEEGGEEETFML